MDTNIEKAKRVATILSCLPEEKHIYCDSCEDHDTCSLLGQAMNNVEVTWDYLTENH